MGDAELGYVQEAFATNWVAPIGPHVNGFEQDLQQYLGGRHVAALTSGTAALHLALVILGVGPGDEVLCQSFTFCGSANPIVYQGATPVFVDSEPETWNLCPQQLEAAIRDRLRKGRKPKALVYVHLYGTPARVEEILAVAARYQLAVIEDAAEALGAYYHGKPCGTLGDISVLSFNGNKIITTSGGGALLSDRADWVEKARFLATQARDAAPHYQHAQIGYNYRLSNICAGIGRGQMQVLDERVRQRRANEARYRQLFQHVAGVSFPVEPEGSFCNRWLTTILIDPALSGFSREDLRLALDAQNIESRPLWKPMHLQPVYQDAPFYGEGTAARLFEQGLCLPSGSNLTPAEWERIAEALQPFLA
jgi:dTDP-4-amino-4,6-dideoxygalactose transaminase